MKTPPPSKDEILEKYKHLISATDWEVITREDPPTPEELLTRKEEIQFMGVIRGWCVWLWRKAKLGAIVAVIVTLHSLYDAGKDWGPPVVHQISDLVSYVESFDWKPTTEPPRYIVFTPEVTIEKAQPHSAPLFPAQLPPESVVTAVTGSHPYYKT